MFRILCLMIIIYFTGFINCLKERELQQNRSTRSLLAPHVEYLDTLGVYQDEYDRWREQGDPDEIIKITNTTTLSLKKSLHLIFKITSDCRYLGFAGPAVQLCIDEYYISSIFTLAELARDSCKTGYKPSGKVLAWITRNRDYSRLDVRLSTRNVVHFDHTLPRFHPRFVGRIGGTELALYKFHPPCGEDVEINLNRDPAKYNNCYVYSHNYLIKDNYNKMALFKHRVFIEPWSGYGEFIIVTDDYENSNASVCGFHNRGSPIFCDDKLTLITVPDEMDETCSSIRQVRAIPMWFIVESIKDMSSEGEELYRRIIAKQETKNKSQKFR